MATTATPTHPMPSLRVDHIGSLIRPRELVDAREAFDAGQLSAEALGKAEDDAVAYVVKRQRQLDLGNINDGEMRRTFYFEGVFDKLQGMTQLPNRPIAEFKPYIPHIAVMYAMGVTESDTIYCSGQIVRVKPFYVDQFKYAKSIVPAQDVKKVKVTMCPPTWFHQRHGSDLTYDRSVYKDDDAYFGDLAIAYRAEIKELYELGCRNIQFDDPTFCFFCSDGMISGMEAAKVDHEALLDTYIRAINMCIENRPSDLTVGVHMCRGNYMGMHFCEGGYDRISTKLFNDLNVDVFYLEYDTPRSGDFAPLKRVPPGKKVVLGVVSTKTPEVETVDYIRTRVQEAAKAMVNSSRTEAQAMDQLAISPQCGFASVFAGNVISEEVQWQKLEVLVDAAKALWST